MEIVSDYLEGRSRGLERLLSDFGGLEALDGTISQVVRPGGKKHAHQQRIPGSVLDRADKVLREISDDLWSAENFEVLHQRVTDAVHGIHGIGVLAQYDFALRLGAVRGVMPEHIYLHAGARIGAAALGVKGRMVHLSELPQAFQVLTPAQAEDCLCHYRDELRGKGSGPAASSQCGNRPPSTLST